MDAYERSDESRFDALQIVLWYSLAGAVWIVVTDLIALRPLTEEVIEGDRAGALAISIGKGLLFVAVTAMLLYFLLQRQLSSLAAANEEVRRHLAASQSHADELELRVEERTARLQEINDELEAFAFTVSHDLREPLRAVQSFACALNDDYAARLDDEGRQLLAAIVEGSGRMEQLIHDLLDYSHLAREELIAEEVDLANVVFRAHSSLSVAMAGRQAEVIILPPLPIVRGHRAAIEQAVQNLLENAVKFVPQEQTPRVRIWAETHGDQVRLWVEDNGIGISPADQERIFRPLERLHAAESYSGSGLGLAIVRRAARRLGGASGVESEMGRGSRFWIELPQGVSVPHAQFARSAERA